MKPMHKLKELFNRLTNSKPATIVGSVAAALLIWFAISMTVYPTTPVTFYNIPLVIETEGSTAEMNGLSVVGNSAQTVNVQIEGARSKIGALSEEDLIATVSLQSITEPGEYPLEVNVDSTKNIDFTVNSIVPRQIYVTFDRIETRSFAVTPEFPNVVIKSGHTMNEVTCKPSVIDITGPAAQLDDIDKVIVRSDKHAEIDSSYVLYSSNISLYNKDNSMLDREAYTMPTLNFTIEIPVLTQKELPLTYDVRNAPANFDMEWLCKRLLLSTDSITLAANSSTLINQEQWNLGYLKLEDIHLNYSHAFPVTVADGVINQSGMQEVMLTLNSEGLEQREFKVNGDNISIINAPGNYDFKVITKELSVTVIGPASELDELRTTDIVVTVDLTNYNVAQSQSFTNDSQISFSGTSRVWASGVYKIAIDCVEHVEDEEEETE